MPDRTKKILFAIFFILFSIGMGYILYLVFFGKVQLPGIGVTNTVTTPPSTLPNSNGGSPTTNIPSTSTGVLPIGTVVTTPTPAVAASRTQLLRDGITQDVSMGSDKLGVRFYNPEDGRFYVINADGTTTALSDKQFFNVGGVSWANQSNQVILTFPDNSKIFYDFTAQKQVDLPNFWSDFNFATDDQYVTAKSTGVDPSNRFLITTKADGTEAKAVEPLGDNGSLVTPAGTPDGQIIAYSETGTPQPDGAQEILFVGQNHENFRGLIAPGQGFMANWSPTGKELLFSVWSQSSNGDPDLWITGGEPSTVGTDRRDLNIHTWVNLCAWGDDTHIYCAVPQGLPADAGIDPEDYTGYPDDVYRIDLTAGTMTKVNTPDQVFPVNHPVVNADQSKFIFTDATTGKLYSYDLK
ncbi:MAG: hypothetical protein WA001_02625 [Patescibacteria group bacterium]